MTLDLAFMLQILPDMIAAFWLTIKISLITVVASVIAGILLTAIRMMGGKISRYSIIAFVEFTRGSIRGRPPRARQFGVRSRVRSHDDDLACLLTRSCKFYKMAIILRTRDDKGMSGGITKSFI